MQRLNDGAAQKYRCWSGVALFTAEDSRSRRSAKLRPQRLQESEVRSATAQPRSLFVPVSSVPSPILLVSRLCLEKESSCSLSDMIRILKKHGLSSANQAGSEIPGGVMTFNRPVTASPPVHRPLPDSFLDFRSLRR